MGKRLARQQDQTTLRPIIPICDFLYNLFFFSQYIFLLVGVVGFADLCHLLSFTKISMLIKSWILLMMQ